MNTFQGPINSKSKKDDLIAVASALEINKAGTNKDLIARINAHLRDHPELANDPRFQGLFSYRAQPTSSQKQLKKSSEKAAEDDQEQETGKNQPTAASQALLKIGFTTDPLPQVVRLGSGPVTMKDVPLPEGSDNESSPGDQSCVDRIPGDEEVFDEPRTPTRAKRDLRGELAMPLVVNFYDPYDKAKQPREVWIPNQNIEQVPISVVEKGDRTIYSTSLAKLLQVAIQEESPIKGGGGRISRKGLSAGHVDLGHVDALLAGTSKTLAFDRIDTYELELEDGYLRCDLFLDEGMSHAASSIKPLEVARTKIEVARTTAQALKAPSGPVDDAFIGYLRQLLATGDSEWPKATTIRHVLDRYLHVEDVFKKLEALKWGRAGGGFKVPADHPERQYRGQTFTRNDVYAASRLPHSKAGADSALFSPMALRNADKAKEWVKDPDGQYGDDFNKLRVAQFKAHLEEQNEKAKYRRHLKGKRKQSSSKGKRPASTSDDSSGEERNGSKYKKSKGKGRKVDTGSDEEDEPKGKKGKGKKVIDYMDSDHMDDSD